MSNQIIQATWPESLRAEWDRFLGGHWQLEIPQKTGTYPTKHYVKALQWVDVVVYHDVAEDRMKCSIEDFGGYYWSEPRPKMPVISEGA